MAVDLATFQMNLIDGVEGSPQPARYTVSGVSSPSQITQYVSGGSVYLSIKNGTAYVTVPTGVTFTHPSAEEVE